MITCAPSAAKSFAVARPSPLFPPVMSATCLSSFGISKLLLLSIGLLGRRGRGHYEFALEYFAVAALGQVLPENVDFGPFEPGDSRKTMRIELGFAGFPPLMGDDKCNHDLAPFRIRPAHNGDLGNIRVRQQRFFDLARIDI